MKILFLLVSSMLGVSTSILLYSPIRRAYSAIPHDLIPLITHTSLTELALITFIVSVIALVLIGFWWTIAYSE